MASLKFCSQSLVNSGKTLLFFIKNFHVFGYIISPLSFRIWEKNPGLEVHPFKNIN